MKILKYWFLEGPNMYSRKPVAIFMFLVAKKTQEQYKDKAEGIFSVMNKVFPGLRKIKYGFYKKGNIRNYKHFSKDSSVSSLVLGIASCFLWQLGIEGRANVIHFFEYGKRKRLYLVLDCPYRKRLSRTAIFAMRLAMGVIRKVMLGKEIDSKRRMVRLKAVYMKERLAPKTELILRAAEEQRIPYINIAGKNLFQLGLGENQIRLDSSNINSLVATELANHKEYYKELLSRASSPGKISPLGAQIYSLNEAIIVANKLGFPVIVKPCAGSLGRGVSKVDSLKDIEAAYKKALKDHSGVIVERFVEGNDYRIMLVNHRVVAATQRIPARVRGDGKHTIKELIEIENKRPVRSERFDTPLKAIKIDKDTNRVLKEQRLTLESVPKIGRIVRVRQNANISTGGESVDVTSKIHPKTAKMLSFVTRILDLKVTGVDLICKDISEELKPGEWSLIEVNARPDIDMHHYPFKGKKRNVAGMIIDMLFERNKKTGIPVWAVTGTNGKTTTTRMIAYILENLKKMVGFTSTGNLSIGETRIFTTGTGSTSARALLLNPKVQMAVIEVAHLGILTNGLGYNASDTTVITNLKEDHVGERVKSLAHPEVITDINDLYRIKSVVARQTRRRGVLVLNADDELVTKMQKESKAEKIFFSMTDKNKIVLEHLRQGGRAVYLRSDGMIIYKTKKKKVEVMHVNKIPATQNGTVKHNVANSLAAIAATLGAKCMKVSLKVIRESLGSFGSDFILNPGRMNMVNFSKFKVIIDYAHNPEGYKTIFNAIEHIPCERRVGVIKCAGDRPNDFVISLGKMAGEFFDRIYIKDPSKEKLRERKSGEIAKLLERGVLESGFSKKEVVIELDELEAVHRALKEAKIGDLIIILAHNIDEVYKLVEQYKKRSIAAKK